MRVTRLALAAIALVALAVAAFVMELRRIVTSQLLGDLPSTAEPFEGDALAVGMPTLSGTDWDAWFADQTLTNPDWRN